MNPKKKEFKSTETCRLLRLIDLTINMTQTLNPRGTHSPNNYAYSNK
jgi:hypothetical protein